MSKESKDDFEYQFKRVHQDDIAGVLFHYKGLKGIIASRSLRISVILAIIGLIVLYLKDLPTNDQIEIISLLVDIGISVDGSLIGLSLAGLTLVVTFGSGDFMKTVISLTIKEVKEGRKLDSSIYQSATTKFTYAVLIQIITLIYLICIKLISAMHFNSTYFIASWVNMIVIFFAILLLFYSLLLILKMTLNIFTLGQQNHLIFFKNEIEKDNKLSEEEND